MLFYHFFQDNGYHAWSLKLYEGTLFRFLILKEKYYLLIFYEARQIEEN